MIEPVHGQRTVRGGIHEFVSCFLMQPQHDQQKVECVKTTVHATPCGESQHQDETPMLEGLFKNSLRSGFFFLSRVLSMRKSREVLM